MTAQFLADLSPACLRLAGAIEARDPGTVARRELDSDGITELADMLLRGDKPTIGWWRRHRKVEVRS